MSQLNLKQVLSSNSVSDLVDIINYNFDQIILNGGGPQGARGSIGAPGLPGLQGDEGSTGPSGATGTYLFTGYGSTPGGYVFTTSPRPNDLFMEVDLSQIVVWQYDGNNWTAGGTVTSPSGNTKLVTYDPSSGLTGSKGTSIINDSTIAQSVFFGDANAYGATTGIINPLDPSAFAPLYSKLSGGNSILTLASLKNQFRIFSTNPSLGLTSATNMQSYGGGVVHSMDVISGTQQYSMINGDLQGNKTFLVNLNGGTISSNLLYGDLNNNLSVGGVVGDNLVSRLSVNNSLAIGNSAFYTTAKYGYSGGLVLQGNLAVGSTDSTRATGFFSANNGTSTSVLLNTSSFSAYPVSSQVNIGVDYPGYDTGLTYSTWSISSSAWNNDPLKYSLLFNQSFRLSGASTTALNYLTMRPQISGSNFQISVGVGNTDSISMFEVGGYNNRFSVGNSLYGNPSAGYLTAYTGFNLYRNTAPSSPVWYRRGDTVNNGGSTIWSNISGNFYLSLIGSSGGATATNTDVDIYNNTRMAQYTNGQLVLTDITSAAAYYIASPLYPPDSSGLVVNMGATGSLADTNAWTGRRPIALFGGQNTGSPVISSTNGWNYSLDLNHIKPQYTFYKADQYGLFLGQGSTYNGNYSTNSVGIAASGSPGIVVTNNPNYSISQTVVGVGNYNPLGRLQIGSGIVIHDGVDSLANSDNFMFLGYNMYDQFTSGSSDTFYLINTGTGLPSSPYRGSSRVMMTDFPSFNRVAPNNNLYGHTASGGMISLDVYGVTSSGAALSNSSSGYTGTSSSVKIYSTPLSISQSAQNNNVPKILAGLSNIYDYEGALNGKTVGILKRGTLAIAAQNLSYNIASPPTILIDNYNIGLYDANGLPVEGISVNNTTTDNLNFVKIVKHSFLTHRGGDVYDPYPALEADLPWMTVGTKLNSPTGTIPSSDEVFDWNLSTVQFGSGFRVGIGADTSTTSTLSLGVTGGANTAVQIVDGNQAAGKVLTSDSSGNATWNSPSVIFSTQGVYNYINHAGEGSLDTNAFGSGYSLTLYTNSAITYMGGTSPYPKQYIDVTVNLQYKNVFSTDYECAAVQLKITDVVSGNYYYFTPLPVFLTDATSAILGTGFANCLMFISQQFKSSASLNQSVLYQSVLSGTTSVTYRFPVGGNIPTYTPVNSSTPDTAFYSGYGISGGPVSPNYYIPFNPSPINLYKFELILSSSGADGYWDYAAAHVTYSGI